MDVPSETLPCAVNDVGVNENPGSVLLTDVVNDPVTLLPFTRMLYVFGSSPSLFVVSEKSIVAFALAEPI